MNQTATTGQDIVLAAGAAPLLGFQISGGDGADYASFRWVLADRSGAIQIDVTATLTDGVITVRVPVADSATLTIGETYTHELSGITTSGSYPIQLATGKVQVVKFLAK